MTQPADKPTADYYKCIDGKWSLINRTEDYLAQHIAVSNHDNTLWSVASFPKQHLAYLRDGRWIEVALLPPITEGCGDEDEDILPEGIYTARIYDLDSYAVIRSKPDDDAPVIGIILNNVNFRCENIDSENEWYKVALNSGLTGYVRSSGIYRIDF